MKRNPPPISMLNKSEMNAPMHEEETPHGPTLDVSESIARHSDNDHQTTFINEISVDKLNECRKQMLDVLARCHISPTEPYLIEFGLKTWKFSRGSHRAVIIKIKKKDLAFRLELVDDSKVEQNYISASFKCPQHDCKLETNSFREYTSHYLDHYQKEENIVHRCCNRDFSEFVVYCKHMHEYHRNFNTIGISFEQIYQHKMKKFLNTGTVSYFPSGIKQISFDMIHNSSLSILKNFGKYFTFFWNCQDFATWLLTYHGVPLDEIEPTLTDKSTGSGTDSNAGCIRNMKKRWYITDTSKEMEINNELGDYAAGYTCNYDKCKYLPPMSITDLNLHVDMAHNNTVVESCYHICRKLVGTDFIEDDIHGIRKFTLYRLRHPKLMAHDSIVFQPWSVEKIPEKMDHYCRIHAVVDDSNVLSQSALKCEVISGKEKYLEHIYDFDIVLNELYMKYSTLSDHESRFTSLTGVANCGAICDALIRGIHPDGIQKEPSGTWHGWFSMLLISFTTIYRDTEEILPLIMLVSRTTESFNIFIAYWLLLHIIVTVLFDGTLKTHINKLRYRVDTGITDIGETFIVLVCLFGLTGLGYQVFIDPSNVSAALVLYYTWRIIRIEHADVIMVYHACRLSIKHVFVTLGSAIYKTLLREPTTDFLLFISFTWSYYTYLVGQVLIIGIVFTIQKSRGKHIIFLCHSRYQWIFIVLYLCIAIAGLFNKPSNYSFENYNRFYMLPYIIHYSYWIIHHNLIGVVKDESRVEKYILETTKNIDGCVDTIPKFKKGNQYLDAGAVIKAISDAMDILSYTSELRYAFVVVIVFVFVTSSMEYFIMSIGVCLWMYGNGCKLFTILAYSFQSERLDDLKKQCINIQSVPSFNVHQMTTVSMTNQM